ncbi:MAG: flippase [bacterium]|nr:flippase [bacterium]
MSLTRAIARNTLIHLIGRGISIIVALAVVAIMTRSLGPNGFGGYSTIIAFLQFFGITVDFGLTLTASRMIATATRQGSERIISNIMGLRFVSAILFLGIAPVIALLFPYSREVKQGMFLTSLSFLAIILGQTLVPVFQKELKMIYPTIAELIGRMVLLAGVLLASFYHAGLIWFMAAVVFGSVAQYIVTHVTVRKFIRWRFAFDWSMWKSILIISWPIGISILFNLIYLKADTILLSLWRPQAEVGLYGASYRVLDQFTALATMFVNLVLPPMTVAWVAGNRERFTRIYQGAFDVYAVLAFPLTVGALLLGQPLMKLVAGAQFTASGVILGIHMIGMIAIFFSTLFGHIIVILNKQKQMIAGYAATAIVGLLLYFYAIPRYGMIGAAWATVATEILIMVITFFAVYRVTRLTPNATILLKSIVASVIMGIVLYLLSNLPVSILLLIGALVYGIALYAIGGIKKETIREILSFNRSLP